MCLNRVTPNRLRKPDKIRIAYKYFDVYPARLKDVLRFPIRATHKHVVVGKWIRANTRLNLGSYAPKRYKSGFHCFPSIKDARKWMSFSSHNPLGVLLPVEVRKIKTVGEYDNRGFYNPQKTIIAKAFVVEEMRVPKNWKKHIIRKRK